MPAAAHPHVIGLDACDHPVGGSVGGKALGLGFLLRQGLRVPPGFVVTTEAYRECLARSGLATRISRELDAAGSLRARQRASARIRALFESEPPAPDVLDEVRAAYHALGGPDAPVAVRSSATTEDTAEASFAGQLDSYLWVQGADEVARHVVRCWGSLFTPQAISYRAHLGIAPHGLAMAVVVQRMVPAEAAGVMLTIDPVTGDRSQIVIEAAFGLGVAVVDGEVTPDRFCVDKVTGELRSATIARKHLAHHFDPDAGGVGATAVPAHLQAQPCLTQTEVGRIALLGKQVERAMGGRAQDIEWAVAPAGGDGEREVLLLQTRPETVWSRRTPAPIAPPGLPLMGRLVEALHQPVNLDDRGPSTLGS
ncbi:MAG TPA: PEP/pyruvate-binding domain-containing protein [Actinomycetes bacterium]|nr:PEP/pyruvate-binding domain-containing protein [Actinomycetes bacterium]